MAKNHQKRQRLQLSLRGATGTIRKDERQQTRVSKRTCAGTRSRRTGSKTRSKRITYNTGRKRGMGQGPKSSSNSMELCTKNGIRSITIPIIVRENTTLHVAGRYARCITQMERKGVAEQSSNKTQRIMAGVRATIHQVQVRVLTRRQKKMER